MHPSPAPVRDQAALSRRRSVRPVGRLHALAVVYALTAALLVAGSSGPIVASGLAIALFTVPGVFVVEAVRPRDPVERLVAVFATSIVGWVLVAHLLLTFQWWHPRPTAALLLAAASVVLPISGRSAVRAPKPRGPLTGSLTPELRTQLRWSGLAMTLWAVSLPFVDLTAISDWGLISVLPVPFFLGLGIAVVVASTAATRPTTSVGGVALAIVPLLVMIYGTLAVLTTTIRYPWAYKHVGVVRLLDESGRFHPNVDIYNNFSGFFGVGALVRGATGVDPTAYAAWAQLFGEALILVAVWVLVRRATDSERVAHLAAVLYLLTNWVAQNYFAAQTLASFLSITVLAMTFSWFATGETRRLRGFGDRLGAMAPKTNLAPEFGVMRSRRAMVLVAFAGLMITHPLTPIATLGAVGLAAALGWLRDRPLLIGFGVATLAGGLRALPYFAAQSFDLGFGGSPTDNAAGNTDYGDAPDVVLRVGQITQLFSVGVWLAAIIGALACIWAMRRTGFLVVAVIVPFGIPLVQSYGGEVIYRVYLYSLPLMVAFVAWGIVTRIPIERRARLPQPTILAATVCLLFTAGFLVAHFGRERLNLVDGSEVAMGEYVAANVADPAVIAQFSGTYPAASSARYPSFQVNDTYTPYVDELLGPSTELPGPDALDEMADDLYGLDAGTPYIVVSPGMIESIGQLNEFPVGSTDQATSFLLTSPRYRVITRIDDSWLIEVLP